MTEADKTAEDVTLVEESKGDYSAEKTSANDEWAKDDGWPTDSANPWSNDTADAKPEATPSTSDAVTKPAQGQGAKKKRPNQQRKPSAKPKDKDKAAERGAKDKAKELMADGAATTDGGDTEAKGKAEDGDVKGNAGGKEVTEEKKEVKEREKKKPYVNPERFKTGGTQVEKLSPEELTQRMGAIRLKNEQIKQRRATVEADEQAFNALQQAEEKKRQATRKVQEQINHSRDEIARRKMERMKDREWDNQKKGGRAGPGQSAQGARGQNVDNASGEQQPTAGTTS